jgi:DNA-binding NarL/FixJ family response regulator
MDAAGWIVRGTPRAGGHSVELVMPGSMRHGGVRSDSQVTAPFPLPDRQWRSVGEYLRLSGRELQIVRGFFNGGTEATIAGRLRLSSHTVHSHVDRIYKKLNVGSRCGLAVRIFSAYLSLYPPDGDARGPRATAPSDSDEAACA